MSDVDDKFEVRSRMMTRWLVILIPAISAAQESLTEARAVEMALEAHPVLAAAQQRASSAEGYRVQAGLRPNPKFTFQQENLHGAWTPPLPYWTMTDTFGFLQQTVETGGRRQKRVDVATAEVRRSEMEVEVLRRHIAARVRQSYWAAAGAQRIRELLGDSLANFQRTVEYQEIRVREGAIAEGDLLRVKLEAERIRLAVNNASLEAEKAKILLWRDMGRTTFPAVRFADPLEVPEDRLRIADPDQALTQRAEVSLVRETLTLAKTKERLEQVRANPTFDWVAGYKRTAGLNTALVGVQADLPFSNRNQGNIQAAGAEVRATESDVAAAEALVRAEVSNAYAEYQTRRQQVRDFLPAFRSQAAETANIAAAAYREGGADLLRLLDAERLRIDVELVAYRALVEYRQSIVALETALGVRP